MKKIVAVAAVLAFAIPAAAFAANTDPYAPPAHFVQPPKLDCGSGGVIADMTVTRQTTARAAFDTLAEVVHRYELACGDLHAVKILVTNK